MAVRTKNLDNLMRQFNARFPNRDRRSDGWIGDDAHMAHTSGHNPDDTPGSKPAWDGDSDNLPEVRDQDIDSDLGEPGTDMDDVVAHLIDLPHFTAVCRYLIWDRHWWHSRDGFVKRPFGGDPHIEHLHFEGAWSQAADNNDTFDFRLEEIGSMAITDADLEKMADRFGIGPKGFADKLGADLSSRTSGISRNLNDRIIDALSEFVGSATTPDESVAITLNGLLGDRKDRIIALMQSL